jgi:hypothetical protein
MCPVMLHGLRPLHVSFDLFHYSARIPAHVAFDRFRYFARIPASLTTRAHLNVSPAREPGEHRPARSISVQRRYNFAGFPLRG